MSRGAARNQKKKPPTSAKAAKALDDHLRVLLEQAVTFLEEELDILTNAKGGRRHGGDTWKEVLALAKGLSGLKKDLDYKKPEPNKVDPKAAWLKANS